jgi:hypothetical protein
MISVELTGIEAVQSVRLAAILRTQVLNRFAWWRTSQLATK